MLPDPVSFADTIAKVLPVKAIYDDAVSPAARQLGALGEDTLKAVRLALFPIQLAAAAQDRFRRFVVDAVNRVPEEKRVSPPPQIIGPVLEGIRYEPEGTPIDEMFSELLSSSMHSDRLNDAHPAIPLVIKQLSSDEANILKSITSSPTLFQITMRFDFRGGLAFNSVEQNEIPTSGLVFPLNADMYRERLERLGIIRFDTLKSMIPIIENGQQNRRTKLSCREANSVRRDTDASLRNAARGGGLV
jgi:hypothetical protein